MSEFIQQFGAYAGSAEWDSFNFWVFPLCSLLAVWFLTVVGLKLFRTRRSLRMVFKGLRAWQVSAAITATLLMGITCYLWTQHFFDKEPLELALLLALFFVSLIPVFCLLTLRNYYSEESLRELTGQPPTPNRLNQAIVTVKRAFKKLKVLLLIPLLGLIMLLFAFNKGDNLITIVYDNSQSMHETDAIEALRETFLHLESNNQIVLTTLEGLEAEDGSDGLATMEEIMAMHRSSELKAGEMAFYPNPEAAISGLEQFRDTVIGSPICEATWKTHLYIRETLREHPYYYRLLIIITDGNDNLLGEGLLSGKFVFDDEAFATGFSSENVLVIDYSRGENTPLFQRLEQAGCDIYTVENNKQDYLAALDLVLSRFKTNWYLIWWMLLIWALPTLIALLMQPPKLV